MESIAESGDRVIVHQALKHLVVAGNALVFMSKDGLKLYPLNRYVVDRDGNGNVIEIVTKETVSKKLVKNFTQILMKPGVVDDTTMPDDECIIYTHVTRDNNRWVWHQEMFDQSYPSLKVKHLLTLTPGSCYASTMLTARSMDVVEWKSSWVT